MGLTVCRMVHVVIVERALRPVLLEGPPSVTAKGADGNVTEELFVLDWHTKRQNVRLGDQ